MKTRAGHAARVLIVEDDDALRELLAIMLSGHGCQIATAQDGRHAIEVLATSNFDLVLLDLMMPQMDGLRLLRWLRKEQGLTVPVVIVSATSDPGTAEGLCAEGANAVLQKPVELPALLDQISKLL